MRKSDKIWIISMAIGIFMLCVSVKQCTYKNAVKNHKTRCDTITKVIFDTVYIKNPAPEESICVRHDTVRLPISNDRRASQCDTTANDSIGVIVPITQKYYSDSIFSVWVSGYHANLDSIILRQQIKTITVTNHVREQERKWNIGLQAGYGMTPKGIQPYVGVGVSYNLFAK